MVFVVLERKCHFASGFLHTLWLHQPILHFQTQLRLFVLLPLKVLHSSAPASHPRLCQPRLWPLNNGHVAGSTQEGREKWVPMAG